ncbi:CoA transferase [Microbacteriaceae bacterium K1510]|nr:CoA transferase [Microbacteriaceae bacterium K1510]
MGPLTGVRVIELGQLIAGPFCGQILADFGAEVVKVEPPCHGDPMRQWGRKDAQGNTLWWPVIARNKKSMTLDLHNPQAQQIVSELAAAADILIENFRPGRMEQWGLGWDKLSTINSRLIMVRISGFGQSGPYASRAGFASVGEAMAGLRHIVGYPDRPSVRLGISLGDTLAGQNGAIGAIMALHARNRTGRGQVVDSAIYEAVLGVMENLVTEYDKGGHTRERAGAALPGIAPSNVYPAADGAIVIGANQDSIFRRLVTVMGKPGLAEDPRFADHQVRGAHQATIDDLIAQWTATQTVAALVEALADAGVPAGPIYRAKDMLEDPHFAAREAIIRVDSPELGPTAMQNVFPRLSDTPGEVRHAGVRLGEHTDAVLSEWLGLAPHRIEQLRASGVV